MIQYNTLTGPDGVNSAAATLSLNFAFEVAVVAVVQTESASETLSGKFSDVLAGDADFEPAAEEAILDAAEAEAWGGVDGTEAWPRGGVALGSGITGTLAPPGTMGLGGEAGKAREALEGGMAFPWVAVGFACPAVLGEPLAASPPTLGI
jgi:hypothetical protein